MTSSHYVHGTDAAEQQRLSTMNRLLNDRCLAVARLGKGERIVDFGAGLGQFSRDMAREAGVKVLGIERSTEQIRNAMALAAQEGEEDLLEMRRGEAETPPLAEDEWGTFDVAHTRFLLEHLRNPVATVRTMVRAVRPGGRIILADDDHETLHLWPEPAGFAPVWRAYQRTYDRHGNDPSIGRRLVQLLHQAGAVPRRNTFVFFGACSGDPDFESFARNIAGVISGSTDDIVETGVAREAVERAIAELATWRTAPDAAIWYGMNWAEGVRQG
jgi:SAM-dependent methyltransferase